MSIENDSITVNSGNLTIFEYSKRGDLFSKWSLTSNRMAESKMWQYTNGLGQRYKRVHEGNMQIYAEQKSNEVIPLGHAESITYWIYTKNGNIQEKWDTPKAPGSRSPVSSTDQQNYFRYMYTASGKEETQKRKIEIKAKGQVDNNVLSTKYSGSNGVYLGGSNSITQTEYNERDQIAKSTTTDKVVTLSSESPMRQDTIGGQVVRHQRYSYYLDGRLDTGWTGNGTNDEGYKTVTYDKRGREVSIIDSNGTLKTPQSAKITTSYKDDGTRNESVIFNGRTVSRSEKISVGGLLHRLYISDSTPGENIEAQAAAARAENKIFGTDTVYKYGKNNIQDAVDSIIYPGEGEEKYREVKANYNQYGLEVYRTSIEKVRRQDGLKEVCYYDRDYNYFCENKANYVTEDVVKTDESKEYTDDGYLKKVTSPVGTTNYILDSRGNRLSASNGYSKKYNADDQMAQYVLKGNSFLSAFEYRGKGARYNDFRYDPFGQQAVNSTAEIDEMDGFENNKWLQEHAVFRDWINIHTVQGITQLAIRRAGNFLWDCWPQSNYVQCGIGSDTYRQNSYQYKDATYTTADGIDDNTSWNPATPFAITSTVKPLEAPVTSLSDTLKLNPLDITTSNLPKLVNPNQIDSNTNVNPQDKSIVNNNAIAPVKDFKVEVSISKLDDSEKESANNNAKKSLFATETPANFDDGQYFEHPIYAQNLQTLGTPGEWCNAQAWCKAIRSNLEAWSAENERQQKAEEQRINDQADSLVKDLHARAYREWQRDGAAAIENISIKLTQDLNKGVISPAVRLLYLRTLADGINEGKISEDDVKKLSHSVNLIRKSKNFADSANEQFIFYFKPMLDMYGKEAIAVAVDLLPIIGNIKGVLDSILGKDAITGEKLGLGGRFLAAAGAVFPYMKGASRAVDASKILNRFKSFMEVASEEGRAVLNRVRGGKGGWCANSFSALTPVRTLSGLVAISALSIGTPVLAYNEQTGQNGYYPITDIITHGTKDQGVTYLTVKDPEQADKAELITTTPEHPFYLTAPVDTQPRPKPQGHDDLSTRWVGAGHLKIGDKIKQANGTTGTVTNVVTVQQTQQMFNLTVDEAHTFYVGQDGWLVHNTSNLECKVFSAGVEYAATQAERNAAAYAGKIFNQAGLRGVEKNITIAVAIIEGKVVMSVNGRATKSAQDKLTEVGKQLGIDIIVPPARGTHAEQAIYDVYGSKVSRIGISNPNGPCQSCKDGAVVNGADIVWFPGHRW
ncbi:YD repeat protein (plasmid) [Deinococcus gobiensis I-0]|uniref:YD repeat protein n=2 Tax=Deinococcus TaxID=1298 RepID=H8H3Y1_DEIGI|nr:YD repeat protein [Deinococcus gobiensis I-0]